MPLPSVSETEQRISVKEQIYTKLKDWIVDGTLKPGEKIVDTEIAAYFHVSRTPVREVFQLLDSQKLIEVIPCKATIVANLNTDNIEEYYLPLNQMQALAASIAAKKILPDQLKELSRIQKCLEDSVANGAAMETFQLDQIFHQKILDIAANPYIIDFTNTLMLHVNRLEYLYFKHSPQMKLSFFEHNEIIGALARGDEKRAFEATLQNWERVMNQIKEILKGGDHCGHNSNS